MKRVQAACILQTLVFSQKPELMYTREQALKFNNTEIDNYKASLEKNKTKYQIVDRQELENGSIVIRVIKQYSDKTDVTEYFD
ncbi:MAG: hypothetical protein IJZ16_06295 [Clostridia bacterium]|nr:hypothetical protein [Clostridia bacterium]